MGLVYQGEWAAILVMASIAARDAYLVIVNAVVFAIWLWFIPTAWGYFRLRGLQPERPRPYRAWGHPVVPGLFLLAAVAIVVNALVTDTRRLVADGWRALPELSAAWGLLLVAAGIPVWLRLRANTAGPA